MYTAGTRCSVRAATSEATSGILPTEEDLEQVYAITKHTAWVLVAPGTIRIGGKTMIAGDIWLLFFHPIGHGEFSVMIHTYIRPTSDLHPTYIRPTSDLHPTYIQPTCIG